MAAARDGSLIRPCARADARVSRRAVTLVTVGRKRLPLCRRTSGRIPGNGLAFVGVPQRSTFARDLVLWMVVLRRLILLAGVSAVLLQHVVCEVTPPLVPVLAIVAVICLYNEGGRLLIPSRPAAGLGPIVNAQVSLDTLALVTLLHFGGGLTNQLGVLFFAPAFFAYGAVLPLRHAFVHVAVTVAELAALGLAEMTGVLAHHPTGFFTAGAYTEPGLVALMVGYLGVVNGLCTYLSHHLSELLGAQEEQSRTLAAERGALLERNEREAARVRALLDVAQHVSGTHTVEALLRAVCDTTVALVRVPRVEIFLWDAERTCLRLAASRGLSDEILSDVDLRYPADVPIVARLRAGEVVDFGAVPGHIRDTDPPFRRGFAAPMIYRGSFEGALFVGYDGENTEELMELVQGIARQAALALANVRTMEQHEEDAEVNRVLLEISQGLSACLDEEALWNLLVRGAAQVIGVPWAVASRFDERSGTFRVSESHGVPDDVVATLRAGRVKLEDQPRLQEALSNRSLVVDDQGAQRPFTVPRGWDVGSWVSIPLFRGSWVAGFLTAGVPGGRRAFTRRQLRLAEGIKHHASIALQNARLVADLENADKLKSEFVSTMSHELRTPLNVIIGYTEMLREGAVGPITSGQLDLIDRLDARGRELLELIEATLDVGRLEAGRDTVEIQPVALLDLVQALKASTAGLPRPPGVAFEWEVPWDARDQVLTDRKKLCLVVRNLVSNAFKFTPDGKVAVRMQVRGDSLVIEVRDTGVGITAEHLPIIFDMFRQVDGSMTRRHGGVGLGLYIVKQFTTRLGGTVDVTSTPGKGSAFRIVLPGAIGEPAAAAEASAA
jgi:signal transduction histidine kinase